MSWQPIKSLPYNIDTNMVLWNPCDGLHLPKTVYGTHEVDEIRKGNVFTHWQSIDPPGKVYQLHGEQAEREIERLKSVISVVNK